MILSNLVIAGLLLTMFVPAFAQKAGNSEEKRERIKTYKIGYLTQKLNLTDEEAQKFWPVYNANKDVMEAKSREFRKSHNYTPEYIEDMTDAEAEKFIKEQLDYEQEMLDLKKKFVSELEGVLPEKKILILLEAEKQFRKDLMKKLASEKRKGGPPPPYQQR